MLNENLFIAKDPAENIIKPFMYRPLEIDKYTLIIGHAGIYGSFFLYTTG